MRGTALQEGKYIVQDLIKMAPGEFGVASAAGKRVVEIDVKIEPVATLGGRHDAESRTKLRGIEIELRVAACRETQRFCDGIERIFERAQHNGIVRVRRHRRLQRHAQKQKVGGEHVA
jgi:hypothetical protein